MTKYIMMCLFLFNGIPMGHAKSISKDDVIGLWHLSDFTIIDKNNKSMPWGDKVHGTLLYTPDNFVAVSINGWKNKEPIYLFYSGSYKMNKIILLLIMSKMPQISNALIKF